MHAGRRGGRGQGELGEGVLRGVAELLGVEDGQGAVVGREHGGEQVVDRREPAAEVTEALDPVEQGVRGGQGRPGRRRTVMLAGRVGRQGGRGSDSGQDGGTECGGRDTPCGQTSHEGFLSMSS
ncbi:hypothetical protein ACFQ1B_13885 [Streptomyces mexicanus]